MLNWVKYFLITSFISVWNLHPGSLIAQLANNNKPRLVEQSDIVTGAEQTEKYFPLLAGKSIGVVCNHTSLIGNVHLVDTLLSSGISIGAVYAPEHGYMGQAGAGATVNDTVDAQSNLKIISLYGNKKKPDPNDLNGIDIMLFDIQDVGVRFYTYISTLALVMEACADAGIPLIVLDRPNPNAFYVDGPVLDTSLRSFVGMYPVPIVYGMTIGEYALMVNGEGWLSNGSKCDLTAIPLQKWARNLIVKLPVRPSPNLPNWQAIYLYPTLCLFEGTIVSVGRGTDHPFQVIGYPGNTAGSYVFIPRAIPGVAENPPYAGQQCFGQNLTGYAESFREHDRQFSLQYLIDYYQNSPRKEEFFNAYFEKLAGNTTLKDQIISGAPEEEIRAGWQKELNDFLNIRKSYLLYPD